MPSFLTFFFLSYPSSCFANLTLSFLSLIPILPYFALIYLFVWSSIFFIKQLILHYCFVLPILYCPSCLIDLSSCLIFHIVYPYYILSILFCLLAWYCHLVLPILPILSCQSCLIDLSSGFVFHILYYQFYFVFLLCIAILSCSSCLSHLVLTSCLAHLAFPILPSPSSLIRYTNNLSMIQYFQFKSLFYYKL